MERNVLKILLIAVLMLLASAGSSAQEDGLNLPAELYILLNEGRVERYGLGAAGVQMVTPEDVFIVDFAVAPDHVTLAYRTEAGLILTSLVNTDHSAASIDADADVPPMRRSGPTLVWSPVGDMLVMTTSYGLRTLMLSSDPPEPSTVRIMPIIGLYWSPQGSYLAAESEDNIWWIYRRQGSQLLLAAALPSSYGTAWLDDGRLIFAPEEGGLLLMDLNSANTQTVLRSGDIAYRLPAVRADGSIVAFIIQPDGPPGSGALEHLQISAGTVAVLSNSDNTVNLEGMHWAPGGQLLTAFRGGAIALVLPDTGQGYPLPIANGVAYAWGRIPAPAVTGLRMPTDAYFLAPDSLGLMQIWRLPADGTVPLRQTRAERDVTAYAVAQDALVFASDETLWWLPSAGESEIQVLAVADSVGHIVLSADGIAVYYDTPAGIHLARVGMPALPERILASTEDAQYIQPQLAPSEDVLLVRDIAAGRYRLLDLVTGQLTDFVLSADQAIWLDDGRILAVNHTGTGLQTTAEMLLVDLAGDTSRTLFALEGVRAASIAQTGPSRVGALLLSADPLRPRPGRLVQFDLNTADGAPSARWVGFVTEPVLGPAEGLLAGLPATAQGSLLLYDSSRGTLVQLANPPGVKDFRWVTFR